MFTEKEAETKWCPYSRPVYRAKLGDCGFQPGNRDIGEDANVILRPVVNCIASQCAMWRWVAEHDGSFHLTMTGPDLTVQSRIPNFKRSDRGYCGLAGKPEVA